MAQLARETLHVDVRVDQAYNVVLDHLLAAFRESGPSDFYFSALTAPPPPGTCMVYSARTSGFFSSGSAFGPPGAQIDAGPLSVQVGNATAPAPANDGFPGTFYALLGSQGSPGLAPTPSLLNTGPFTLIGSGFRVMLESAAAITWTNRDQVNQIDRAKDLALTWTAVQGANRGVVIVGTSELVSHNGSSGFVCVAPPGATTFSVPSYVLMALPASDGEAYRVARISLGDVPLTSAATLPGYDRSYLGVSNWSSKTAVIR